MRQRISHGAVIDAATPAEVAALIANAQSGQDTAEYTSVFDIIPLDGSGNNNRFTNSKLIVPKQYDWKIERVSIGGQAQAASALVLFYINDETNDTNLLEPVQLGTAGLYGDSFSNDLHVPAAARVVVVVQGGPANGAVSFRFQIRLEKRRQPE